MKPVVQRSFNKKPKPLLIGILIDVSSSMQRNWQNKDGKKLPRIEVIQEALNSRLKKISLLSPKGNKIQPISLFCLGMGFKRPIYLSGVELKFGHEKKLESGSEEKVLADIICDIFALSEIIPAKQILDQLDTTINSKWNNYARELLEQVKTDDDIYDQLQSYIQGTLYKSGDEWLYHSFLYKSYDYVKRIRRIQKFGITKQILAKLSRQIEARQRELEILPSKEGSRYFNSIINCTEVLFQKKRDGYQQFIKESLDDFVGAQVKELLYLLSIGYPFEKVLAEFKEEKVRERADVIYRYLEGEVKSSIEMTCANHLKNLKDTKKRLNASLDFERVGELTKECIKKYSWNILHPFVEKTVKDLFEGSFKAEARKQFPKWIGLASNREVVISLNSIPIGNVFPDTFGSSLYSEEFMFGSTPINEAMDIVSMRLLDQTYTTWDKVLVIISDGEFKSDFPIYLADLLKKADVLIISCCVTDSDIMTKLISKYAETWPKGAKNLFEIASTIDSEHQLAQIAARNRTQLPEGKKWFYQINHSETLEDFIQVILPEWYESF